MGVFPESASNPLASMPGIFVPCFFFKDFIHLSQFRIKELSLGSCTGISLSCPTNQNQQSLIDGF